MSALNRSRQSIRISVSSNRQITIPKEFCEQLGIGAQVTLELHGNHLVLRPFHERFDDFSEEILEELVEEGYSGVDLLNEFKMRKNQMRSAVNSLIAETTDKGKRTSVDDLFGDDDEV